MNITVNHIPKDTAHNRRPGNPLKATSITIHSTANLTSSAKGERNWLTNPSNTRTASWHYAVDEVDVIEALPATENAWAATDGANGPGNRTSIHVEMCESGNRELVLKRTQELVVYLMVKYDIKTVVRHRDWYNKNCPRILNGDGKWTDWFRFHKEIMELHRIATEPKPVEIPVPADSYRVVSGDTLWGLAAKFNTTVTSLKLWNGLKSDVLSIGQILKVKAPFVKQDGVISQDVWTHSKPDFEGKTRVKVLKKGEKVSVFGEEGDLYKIGTNLYVSKKYVIIIKTPVAKTGVATGDVYTHSKPDFKESTRDVVLLKGKSVGVYGEVNGMYKIRLNGKTLYVSKKYLTVK